MEQKHPCYEYTSLLATNHHARASSNPHRTVQSQDSEIITPAQVKKLAIQFMSPHIPT